MVMPYVVPPTYPQLLKTVFKTNVLGIEGKEGGQESWTRFVKKHSTSDNIFLIYFCGFSCGGVGKNVITSVK